MFNFKKSLIFSIALIVAGLVPFIFSTNSIEAKMEKEPIIEAQPGGKNAWTKPAGYYGEHGEGVDSNEDDSNEDDSTEEGGGRGDPGEIAWPEGLDRDGGDSDEGDPASTDPNDDPWHPDFDPWPEFPPANGLWPDDELTQDD